MIQDRKTSYEKEKKSAWEHWKKVWAECPMMLSPVLRTTAHSVAHLAVPAWKSLGGCPGVPFPCYQKSLSRMELRSKMSERAQPLYPLAEAPSVWVHGGLRGFCWLDYHRCKHLLKQEQKKAGDIYCFHGGCARYNRMWLLCCSLYSVLVEVWKAILLQAIYLIIGSHIDNGFGNICKV